MKKRNKWVLLALIAVVAIILVVALLRGCQQDGKNADPSATVDPELPLDDSPLVPGTPSPDGASDGDTGTQIDPESGLELEEDELPIMTN